MRLIKLKRFWVTIISISIIFAASYRIANVYSRSQSESDCCGGDDASHQIDVNKRCDSNMSQDSNKPQDPNIASQEQPKAVEQTTCPVMGGAINKELFTTYKDKKVYFCCPSCKGKFENDPDKYTGKLPQFGKK